MKVTKYELMEALFTGKASQNFIDKTFLAIVNSVEREDGSGKNFNVDGYTAGGSKRIVFVQTID